MNDNYIFTVQPEATPDSSYTVIFVPQDFELNLRYLRDEVTEYFQTNYLPLKIYLIFGEYLQGIKAIDFQNKVFDKVIGFDKAELILYCFSSKGQLKDYATKKVVKNLILKSQIVQYGMSEIFIKRGGLVESSGDHHFVFPSGKHCSKFLRTGNVLQNNAEIYFIAFAILHLYEDDIETVYCDTSSINIIAYTLTELKRRFSKTQFALPSIKSFSSYEVFERPGFQFNPRSLILVSSSTSGNIVQRLIRTHNVKLNQIIVVFYLGDIESAKQYCSQLICDLTLRENFKIGIDEFESYNNEPCKLCERHSMPIKIRSDVFLSVKPKINQITIKAEDFPRALEPFLEQFAPEKKDTNNVISCFYEDSEDADLDYEIYLNIECIIDTISEPDSLKYRNFKEKLDKQINLHIPVNTKYLLFLPDPASKKLAEYILGKISSSLKDELKPKLLKYNELHDISKEEQGTLIVVASSIVSGRKFIYLSRELREFKYSPCYFIAITRPNNEEHLKFIKSNISRGWNGPNTYPVVSVEPMLCTDVKRNTSWYLELDFWDSFKAFVDDNWVKKQVETRVNILKDARKNKGLTDNVFFSHPSFNHLSIRKNFAFLSFENYDKNLSQADIYFVLSAIMNQLRNCDKARNLKQSGYVRNILAPDNFNRFNDGIIQASILRTATAHELAYDLEPELSNQMRTILESMVEEFQKSHAEALLEFIIALGTRKLRLVKGDLQALMTRLSKVDDILLKNLAEFLLQDMATDKKSPF